MGARRPEAAASPVTVTGRTGSTAVAVALALAGGLLLGGWWTFRADEGFGAPLPPAPSSVPAPSSTPAPSSIAPSSTPEGRSPAVVGRRDAAPTALPLPPAPVRVEVPALGVDAAVVAVGVDGSGAVAVPDDPRQVGWYRWGPVPGAPGNAVLAGHVDTRGAGPGALFDLQHAEAGTPVRVTAADGGVEEFVVTARRNLPKAELPTAELFARAGPPVLVLVTCGGAFDRATGHYAENVVVVASARP